MEQITLTISFFSLFVASLAIWFAYRQTKANETSATAICTEVADDHEYRRREFSIKLARDWDDSVLISRSFLLQNWPDHFNSNIAIPWSEIQDVKNEQLKKFKSGNDLDRLVDTSEYLFVTDHINIVINFFDMMSASITSRVANEEILKTMAQDAFYNWYCVLEDYKKTIIKQRKYNPWEASETLYLRWYKSEKPMRSLSKTGVIDAQEIA